eukprot:scaffold1815_cov17-Tisochrysis_lutea.AAC.8
MKVESVAYKQPPVRDAMKGEAGANKQHVDFIPVAGQTFNSKAHSAYASPLSKTLAELLQKSCE